MQSEFENLQARINSALLVAEWGSFDGAHHKMWVIDQMVQTLIGNEDDYARWVEEFEGGWKEGIAP